MADRSLHSVIVALLPLFAAAVVLSITPALAKKDGNEVRQESGSSGVPATIDDRLVRGVGGRDDGATGSTEVGSGRGGGNSGSTRNGGLDEVAKRLDDSAGVPAEGGNGSVGQFERVRVRFLENDRL